MSKNLVFLFFLSLAVVVCTASTGLAQTIEVRIATGSDDAEEHLSAGNMDITSSDLEFPYEDDGTPSATDEQVVALRFIAPIPKGAYIKSAYIEFQMDETKGNDRPVNVIIEGQLHPNPPTFTTATNNITNRAPWTNAQVQWTAPLGLTVPEKFQTADIAAVIQEIVNQSGWESGNALVIAIRDDKSNPSTGIRCVEAYEGDAAGAPLLVVEISRIPASVLSPTNSATDVAVDATLNWIAGLYAATHDVYFGTAFADVDNASRANPMGVLVSQGQTSTEYDPAGLLEFGQTYYWRIDEVNGAPDNTIFKGGVWSFTVEPYAYPIENIVATASSTDAESSPARTIDGSGLNADDQHSVDAIDMWLTAIDGEQPTWIQYEFPETYALHEMWVWNYNVQFEPILGFGFKEVTVEYSIDGEEWTTLGDFEFAQAAAAQTYAPNTTLDLDGVVARYVRLTANSNWSGMMPQFGLSEVRFYYKPTVARNPIPTDGQTDLGLDVALDWYGGRHATTHEVYFSADEQAVIDGAAPIGTTAETRYEVSGLNLGTTYYWKVNEINEDATPSVWEGSVWSFSTASYLVVEDFESYNDEDALIYEAWEDGYDDPANGSQVGHLMTPFAEMAIVRSGSQSMPLFYDNTGLTMAEARYTFAAQDWTLGGIRSLSLWFHGAADNNGQLYVKINNTKIVYDGDPVDIKRSGWQVWNIDLSTVGGNMNAVTRLTIGVEGAGANGVVYVDDIRLYPKAPEYIEPVEPASTNLVGRYSFEEGTGAVVQDSSGLGNHGEARGNFQRINGISGSALQLSSGGYVVIDAIAPYIPDNTITFSAWIQTTNVASSHGCILSSNTTGSSYELQIGIESGNVFVWDGSRTQYPPSVANGEWHHVTYVMDGNTAYIYVDGMERGTWTTSRGFSNQVRWSIGQEWDDATPSDFYTGGVDEVMFFSEALSAEEVLWLAGMRTPRQKPL